MIFYTVLVCDTTRETTGMQDVQPWDDHALVGCMDHDHERHGRGNNNQLHTHQHTTTDNSSRHYNQLDAMNYKNHLWKKHLHCMGWGYFVAGDAVGFLSTCPMEQNKVRVDRIVPWTQSNILDSRSGTSKLVSCCCYVVGAVVASRWMQQVKFTDLQNLIFCLATP